MPVLKRIGVLSVAKIYGIMGVIMGFIIGLFLGLFGLAVGSTFGAAFGILAIILMPIIYGVLMFLLGAGSAILYNFIAGRVGGMEFEVEVRQRKS